MRAADPYAARHRFVDPARGQVTLLGLVGSLFLVEIVWSLSGPMLIPWNYEDPGTAWRTLVVHLTFLALVLPTFLCAWQFQRRSPYSLFGPRNTLLSDLRVTVKALFILYAVLHLIPGSDETTLEANLAPLGWVLLLPIACLAVFIQTSAEEILYRGFLQQSLGALSDSRLVWMVLPSVLFGVSHYQPSLPFDVTGPHVIWATFFGLAAADLTARTGSLGAAMGMHFAYNLPLVALYAEPGLMSGFGLFVQPVGWAQSDPSLVSFAFDLFYLWIVWMTCRVAIRC